MNEAVDSLNWLAGRGSSMTHAPSPMQRQVLGRLDGLASRQQPKGGVPSAEEALCQLLRGGSPCDWKPANETLASYQAELVSVPDDVKDCPSLAQVLPHDDLRYLEEKSELMLRHVDEVEQSEPIMPYWDPKLKFNKKEYHRLVQRLHDAGYFYFTTRPRSSVGIFFVWKSSRTRLRLITDARRPNQLFKAPPGVRLMTSEGFGKIEFEVTPDVMSDPSALSAAEAFIGLSDVKDCFHRMRVPEWISHFFAWEAVPAKVVGLGGAEVDGRILDPLDPVWPCAGSLCQGWSWSLYFAQRANECVCLRSPLLREASLVSDKSRPIIIQVGARSQALSEDGEVAKGYYYVYVDNLGVIDTEIALVEHALNELQVIFNGMGLELHKSEVGACNVEALGCVLDGHNRESRLNPTRLWRLRQGIRALLRRGKCTGRSLEVVIGHCTFCALMFRPSLSIFNTVYSFIQASYYEVSHLWRTVREELQCFKGVLLLLCQDWTRPWNPLVSSSDSSLSGYGVCQAWWPRSNVAESGRVSERARFRRVGPHSARESALLSAGLGEYVGLDAEEVSTLLANEGWGVDPTFPEIPAAGLRRNLWVPKMWGAWRYKEGILVLESRAALKGLKRILMTRHGHDMRQLLLCDNMACVLCFERGRCKNYAVLNILREYCAFCLAKNVSVTVRWIPSELNISDEPSRIYDTEESKLLVDFLTEEWGRHGPASMPDTDSWGSDRLVCEPGGGQAWSKETAKSGGRPSCSSHDCAKEAVSEFGPGGHALREAALQESRRAEVADDGSAVGRAGAAALRGTQGEPESESASTSSELREEKRGKRERVAKQRRRRLLQQVVDAEMTGQSLLEDAAVTRQVRTHYQRRQQDLEKFVKQEGIPFSTDEEVDLALVKYFNQAYLEGEGSHFGDYTIAAFLDKVPEFGRLGSRKIPRAWRCLKGWRKLCPSRSRLAYPLAVWCGVSWRMVVRGQVQMAVFNLLQVSTYHRPNTLLKLRKMGLVRPTSGITGYWSMVTSLSETQDVSKTGSKDDSVLLDSAWLAFLGPILEVLSQGKVLEKVWDFSYAEYLSVFQKSCQDLKIELVPYQARHSGPSIDRASNARSQEEVRKRGGWVSRQSVARYEKAGRLAATWKKLPTEVQLCCVMAEKYIEEIILGQDYPVITIPG